jgi:hypothetical protein
MINYLLFDLALFLFCCNSFGMQNNAQCADKMVKISVWKDVIPFANKIVAYTTDSYYYSWKEDGYLINGNTLNYGLIDADKTDWRERETGFKMSQLQKKESGAGTKALVDSLLKDANLYMRLINKDEINKIREAIKADAANFEYCFDKEKILLLLDKQENDNKNFLTNVFNKLICRARL